VCDVTRFYLIFDYGLKLGILRIFKDVLKLVKVRFNRTVKYLKIDGETTLGREFDDLMASEGVTVERNSPNILD
jgi:hypothetical protein